MRNLTLLTGTIALLATVGATAGPRDIILEELAALAKTADPAFTSFDAKRGGTLFSTKFTLGKPEIPGCTTCHTSSPTNPGETRAGKAIAPMALSVTADRYSDPKKVAKWFRRNCNSVLGRECTALEKGNFLTFMVSQ